MDGLTQKLAFVVDCLPNQKGEPDLDRLESANIAIAEYVVRSQQYLGKQSISKKVLLDIGCGNAGSDLVNRVSDMVSDMNVVSLDSSQYSLDKLHKPNKVHADATNIPFHSNSFDFAYAGHVINSGVLLNGRTFFDKNPDESYRIAAEAMRVLKPGGLFIFTYIPGRNDRQTLENLSEVGFNQLEHLLRILWFAGVPTDTYAARK